MNILVIDDDKDSRESMSTILGLLGHTMLEAGSAEEGLERLRQVPSINLLLSDIKMPGKSGIDFLRELRGCREADGFDVVLFTGFATVETAVDALRLGAYDYLLKPVGMNDLVDLLDRVGKRTEIRNRNMDSALSGAIQPTSLYRLPEVQDRLGFFSKSMHQKMEQAIKFHEDRGLSVLIQGETGVGKELMAKLIHHGLQEGGCHLPFIDINCAAIMPSLFESELFGYEHGAFTGGLKRGQLGKFDAARGGTLFLDEVAEIPLEKQGILLRVLQEKEFYRVGGTQKIKTDVRIICATNVSLEDAVKAGNFRKDLYYRLKVGMLYLPPLRQRLEEIIPLSLYFLRELSRQKGKRFQNISPEAAKELVSYSWPGNVRELRNAIELAVFMHDAEVLTGEHLHLDDAEMGEAAAFRGEKIDGVEGLGDVINNQVNNLVQRALEDCGGNKTAAAEKLGISRRKLYRLLEKVK
ncbi:sigma-54-dependent transcriptional regulator [Propionispora hippei]|uniref:DNA-binding transcriptional response regulator, NtrC family, contains REC, AAA-type ATPase, and a Fis-type DNA-binding domains n=1 Tax=Propionispora hippei DSM 15287 TaxID=1123003 RepID=A0A1M6NT94_9FIRM|nr:sigma-54 dependent transcriptional regulator [Propionispora hippei]SHJ98949.1 DNA-binding transcriptional response regulator, NtrC family, contains REC, AAA-type ATPase, and a Fis-type DNA-binding domains [Propionispora hippei DSM 15287]